MKQSYLILTVGTGTAGPHSNLVLGLRRTMELIAPERFWLIFQPRARLDCRSRVPLPPPADIADGSG